MPLGLLLDCSNRYIAKSHYHSRIAAYAIVVVMPSQFGSQRSPPILDAHNAANLPQPVVDPGTGFSELLAGRLTAQQKRAFTAVSAEMCKAQKVERIGPATFSPGVLSLEPAKTNRPGLFRMKSQSEFRKSFSKHPFDFSGDLTVLNHTDKIIRIADQITLPVYARLDSLDKPQVQYIM